MSLKWLALVGFQCFRVCAILAPHAWMSSRHVCFPPLSRSFLVAAAAAAAVASCMHTLQRTGDEHVFILLQQFVPGADRNRTALFFARSQFRMCSLVYGRYPFR